MSFWLAGVNVRVIDPFTIKPLDAATIVASARATQGKVITVEDHYKEGKPFSVFVWRQYDWIFLDLNEQMFRKCVLRSLFTLLWEWY